MKHVPPLEEDSPFADPPSVLLGANEKAFLVVLCIVWVAAALTLGRATLLAYAAAITIAIALAAALLRRATQRNKHV